ncbi:MAG TPA: rhomboid family intramembrane serine protease [Chitinophagaceae bacterium]|nr:rhomboid family intramembrane serine protease [Chitinophagaceae bacterium]
MGLSITLIIVIITGLVSFGAFNNEKLKNDLIFYPPYINRGQVYRFITHGFIHADIGHLIFNMIALYSFGEVVEMIYEVPWVFGSKGKILYLLLYFSALIIASVPDYIKHKDNYYYRSLGASGAVSAVIFSSILFNPNAGIGLIFIPGLAIPGYIFGIIYIIVSTVLARRGQDNIGHGAHITGAIYGLIFTYVTTKLMTDIDILDLFWKQVTGG